MDFQLDKTGVETDQPTINTIEPNTFPEPHNKGAEVVRKDIGTCIYVYWVSFGGFWRKKIGKKQERELFVGAWDWCGKQFEEESQNRKVQHALCEHD